MSSPGKDFAVLQKWFTPAVPVFVDHPVGASDIELGDLLSCAVTTPACHPTLSLVSALLSIFFPCTLHPFYILPHPFCHFLPATVLLHLFQSFSCASSTASALKHVSHTSAHFRHCILSLLSLPLTSADILPFVHPYICLYICSSSHVCSFSLNINYRPPSVYVCPLLHTSFPFRAQHTS